MALSDVKCRNTRPASKLQKLSDGGGLQLWVQPSGTRLWRLAYRFDGKQKLLSLGSYPVISLADARQARDEAKRLLKAGADPAQQRKFQKASSPKDTFRSIADEYVEKLKKEGRADRTISKVKWLLDFAYPTIGDKCIREIDTATILAALRRVEVRGRYESARRLRSTIGTVFRFAIATARAEADPTIALRGALISPTVTPRAAITDPKALGGLLRAVDAFDGQPTTRAALRLMAMLFPRPGELRAAEWGEFDFESSMWIIPEARMKMRRPHRVPLSRQAVSVLASLREISGGGSLLFSSVRSVSRPISDNTLNAALRRMGYGKEEATAHGFRATASTLLNECGKWHPDAIERQLAHIENNDVRRAYARAEHWEERVKMMQWWANYLDELKSKNAQVISIGGRGKPAAHAPGLGTNLNPTATVHQTPRRISNLRKSY
ncbi:integrase arm-type DNA-binding domain-containing protein [Mesorhizobium sp. VK25A]|uniref:Integrase arm-type DNA-binding domain-containing protein n=2 Tax=Mesorhizobium TaxID=68287 RepID=A0ABU5AEK2_9HYPH|nr:MULTISPECIES: integrase arm-type DNA-binding domain-containing protein [unclassified Mesorhizobium]MDX8469373.1 integrase arm-type DNA-binding domain-containing protein [Mesorhizobium sp. VK23B]MDX8475711.1 integrase arm-type DNA-binding domain-containing protein [Mesorhizobium sp. VK23A]MDX8509009.1 integrase arm-type DNA-binding domain-containing protein [Mesorhizobium sp. VK22E]MDX8535696.1 integrase arm-type DNA-binding domain-containing protein [Mesorhizobium sp. VK25D]MDX8548422.1 int